MNKKINFIYFFLGSVLVFFGKYFADNVRIFLFVLLFITAIFHAKDTFKYILISLKDMIKQIRKWFYERYSWWLYLKGN